MQWIMIICTFFRSRFSYSLISKMPTLPRLKHLFVYFRLQIFMHVSQTTVSSTSSSVINLYLDNDILSEIIESNAKILFGFVTLSMQFSIFHFFLHAVFICAQVKFPITIILIFMFFFPSARLHAFPHSQKNHISSRGYAIECVRMLEPWTGAQDPQLAVTPPI